MVDEHGRSERRRHVPDVIEREKRRMPTDRLERPEALAAHADAEAPLEGFSPDAPDVGYWRGLDSGHRWALVGGIAGAALLVALVGVAGYYLLNLREPEAPRRPVSSSVPSSVPTSSAEASGSTGSSASVAPTSVIGTKAVVTTSMRAPLIAYRAGGSIWVSGEHGGNTRSIYPSTAGVFVLSPDGTTLAVIDSSLGVLRLISLTSGRNTPIGDAVPLLPEWAPDSSFLVYTRPVAGYGSEEVARVEADGSGARKVLDGWRGRVMADGATLIAAPAPSLGGSVAIAVLSNGRRLSAKDKMTVTEACPASGGFYYADAGGVAGAGGSVSAPSLQWLGYDGMGARVVVVSPASAAGVSFSNLQLSPDGAWLVYAETGDDGYSRLFALKTSGAKPIALTPRLDGYFIGWSADGTELFLVEGNAMQGEATRVSAMRPDGSGHRIVVEGGGM
jgi:hypothetical protein